MRHWIESTPYKHYCPYSRINSLKFASELFENIERCFVDSGTAYTHDRIYIITKNNRLQWVNLFNCRYNFPVINSIIIGEIVIIIRRKIIQMSRLIVNV